MICIMSIQHFDGLLQERSNSSDGVTSFLHYPIDMSKYLAHADVIPPGAPFTNMV